jgi:hypothetical protein
MVFNKKNDASPGSSGRLREAQRELYSKKYAARLAVIRYGNSVVTVSSIPKPTVLSK